MMQGTGVSAGIALGKVLIIQNEVLDISKRQIKSVEDEKDKLNNAIEKSKLELIRIKDKALGELGEEESAIFEAHLMILEDQEIISKTLEKVEDDSLNIEYAYKEIVDEYLEIFASMDDEYMKERALDIRDVSNRVLRNIMGIKVIDLSKLDEEVILVANDLTPSETAIMDKEKVLGFLTNVGGRTSHTAIMARSLEIPAIVGLKNITEVLKQGDYIAFDGRMGKIVINPNQKEMTYYKELKSKYAREKIELKTLIGQESVTIDGRKVELAGNIGTPNDIEGLLVNDAEGVGLFRTEFIYFNNDSLPSEEEQFVAYKEVLKTMNPKPIVIRTLDIGGDKELPYLNIDKEMNPFLGYRAIRLCLDQQDIFRTQLRALLRASIYGKLKIMFPMISNLEELLETKKILNEVKICLDDEGIEYATDVEIGMMIEVPSAAIASHIFAKHVDFFSIGTNDLIQYTCAVDRGNEKISHLYNPLNPAVIRLIKMVIENGHKEGIRVGMCGEMAGDENLIPLLIGFGLDEFSMTPTSILRARKVIRELKYEEMKKLADEILELSTAKEIENHLEKSMKLIKEQVK